MCQLHGPEIRPPQPTITSAEQMAQLVRTTPSLPRWALELSVCQDYGQTPDWWPEYTRRQPRP